MNLTLQRTAQSADGPTFGTITDDADGATIVPAILELPDRGNQPDISRVPAGVYEYNRTQSHDIGYEVFETQQVPNRSGIALHKGNWLRDTKGCQLCGMTQGTLDGEAAVLQSGEAFALLMAHCANVDRFTLTVVDVAP